MQRVFVARPATAAAASFSAAGRLFTSRRLAVEDFSGTTAEFDAKVSKGVTIVDFFTTWCGPCNQMAPKYKELSETYKNVTFLKIDVEENEDIGAAANVRSIPLFALYKDGKRVGQVEGANLVKLTELISSGAK